MISFLISAGYKKFSSNPSTDDKLKGKIGLDTLEGKIRLDGSDVTAKACVKFPSSAVSLVLSLVCFHASNSRQCKVCAINVSITLNVRQL